MPISIKYTKLLKELEHQFETYNSLRNEHYNLLTSSSAEFLPEKNFHSKIQQIIQAVFHVIDMSGTSYPTKNNTRYSYSQISELLEHIIELLRKARIPSHLTYDSLISDANKILDQLNKLALSSIVNASMQDSTSIYELEHRINSLEKFFKNVTFDTLKIDIEKIKSELNELHKLTIELNNIQNKFDKNIADLGISIKDSSLSQEDLKSNISNLEKSLNESLNKIQTIYNNQYRERIESLDAFISQLETSASDNISLKLETLNLTFEQFQTLISSKTTEELSKNYKDQRDYERKLYFRWNAGAILVLIASIAWTIFSIIALNSSLKELADVK